MTIAIVIGSTIGRTEITVRAIAAVVVGTAEGAAEGVGVGEVLLEEEKEEKKVHRERGSGDEQVSIHRMWRKLRGQVEGSLGLSSKVSPLGRSLTIVLSHYRLVHRPNITSLLRVLSLVAHMPTVFSFLANVVFWSSSCATWCQGIRAFK